MQVMTFAAWCISIAPAYDDTVDASALHRLYGLVLGFIGAAGALFLAYVFMRALLQYCRFRGGVYSELRAQNKEANEQMNLKLNEMFTRLIGAGTPAGLP